MKLEDDKWSIITNGNYTY